MAEITEIDPKGERKPKGPSHLLSLDSARDTLRFPFVKKLSPSA